MKVCRFTYLPVLTPLLVGAAVMKSRHVYRQRWDCEKPATAPKGLKDIVDTALAAGSFKTLVKALLATDLDETLKGDGPFTVFAPTDEAFAKLPAGTLEDLLKPENKGKLSGILTYHVIPAKLTAAELTKTADVIKTRAVKTVNGQLLSVNLEDDNVMVDKAKVVKTDIDCGNGVIHVIDSVLLPKDE